MNIIPKPNYFDLKDDFIIIKENETIKTNDYFSLAINSLIECYSFKVKEDGKIEFIKEDSLEDEEYILDITKENIIIKASSDKGAFYAVQSLRQLLPLKIEGEFNLQCITIKDKPEFKYRGFSFDVARHFFNKDEIIRMIDLISLFKYNTLHMHVSDDQGFRLDIEKYPRLKEISSKRERTLVKGCYRKSTFRFDNIEHSGYYTKEDISSIVEHASKRFIKVIPEIDLPGHTQAILSAYKDYLCNPRDIKVRDTWGVSTDVMCIGNDKTIDFAYDLCIETLKLFKSDIIHIGGDECPITEYKKCPKCQKLMKKENMDNEHGLQEYFTSKLSKRLLDAGYKVRAWNEAATPKLSKDVEIQYWVSPKPEIIFDCVKRGNKIIASPFFSYYLDYLYPLFDLKNTYNFNPYYDELKGEYKENILGVEAPIWTEWVPNRERLDFQVFPRALAISESGWTNPNNKNYDDFINRLDYIVEMLKGMGVNPSPKKCYMQKELKMSPFIRNLRTVLMNDHPANKEFRKYRRDK